MARKTPTNRRGTAAGREARAQALPIRRWLPTALFGLLVAGVIFLFAALRILAQAPGLAEPATAPTTQVTEQTPDLPVLPAAQPAAGEQPPADVVTQQGGITFTARQVDPSYTVVAGDSLSAIARRYGTTPEALQGINNLPDSFLRVGQRLVIP